MGISSKIVTLGFAVAGMAGASQLPEFTQQYRQRLGGAVDELKIVVADFDRDAKNSGLTRLEALSSLKGSLETFPKERGISMEKSIARYHGLSQQMVRFENADPASRPVFMLSDIDQQILSAAWQDFEPAIPINSAGFLWGGFGLLFGGLFARLPVNLSRRFSRLLRFRRNRIIVDNTPHQQNDIESAVAGMPDNGFDNNLYRGNVRGNSNQVPSSQHQTLNTNSLLDQIGLDEKLVGEISANGKIIKRQ